MGKDRSSREGGDASSSASQSKRPGINHQDSDSQVSDQASQHGGGSHHTGLHRTKPQKHIVGGGGAGRLHARVPSSKALYKQHHPAALAAAAASSTKQQQRRQPSPDPTEHDDGQLPWVQPTHRRATSEVKLSRESSTTNLIKKNASHSSLIKRNRSHIDVGKRNKSSGQLKRSLSNPGVDKLKAAIASGGNSSSHNTKNEKTQVHFDLGNDDQEDEWVDASTSASPYLSRRTSVAGSGQSSARQPASPEDSRPQSLSSSIHHRDKGKDVASSSSAGTVASSAPDRATVQHKINLTSRLLQRTPSTGAPPMMSSETASASARPPPAHQPREQSPDSGLSRQSTSTLSGTPQTPGQNLPGAGAGGASAKDDMTSRFVTNSQGVGSAATGSSSFYNASRGSSSRPGSGIREEEEGLKRPRSMGALSLAGPATARSMAAQREDEDHWTDEDGRADSRSPAGEGGGGGRARRAGAYVVPPAADTRVQQKLDLQRASSTIEPSHRHHQGAGVAAGALIGGAGYDTRDPRIGKLLERTGMEYLVVRRYQNPVARSIARLSQLPGADKNRRIPNGGTGGGGGGGGTPSRSGAGGGGGGGAAGHAKRVSEYGGGRFGLSQSFRDEQARQQQQRPSSAAGPGHGAAVGNAKRPVTPKRATSYARPNGAGPSGEAAGGGGGGGGGGGALSGSSLVDGEDDDGTVALLRNLWEKNLDLSASQE
ncbi:uncharacterized protein E0L32_004452 [Thyridium curvatum]|uniref:Uncharacterized protein n=1 Tax=Thyridium curvatum TaxID=1093900 RepID=A0A507AZQ2_9PEZI|nr:uncharacterized protein E0L32_004452 [Thyridium curvatum]TPX15472.1 hypothetical protein E0L32_004452 [Thyridium curvatum]